MAAPQIWRTDDGPALVVRVGFAATLEDLAVAVADVAWLDKVPVSDVTRKKAWDWARRRFENYGYTASQEGERDHVYEQAEVEGIDPADARRRAVELFPELDAD